MRLLKLLALAMLAVAAAPPAAQSAPEANLQAVLRPAAGGPDDGFGLVKFRQPKDDSKIVLLGVWVRDLAPHHSYVLQRATDADVNDDCIGTNWLTLGQGPNPAAIMTDDTGTGRADLFRDLSNLATGTRFDIRFRVFDPVSQEVLLQSGCYQFTVRQ